MEHLLHALFGAKWNMFSPSVPTEALFVDPRVDNFRRRIRQLTSEGGFAILTGEPGTGKSAALRIVADDLAEQRDVVVGTISRPQASIADFYRELGHLQGHAMRPHNRWNSSEMLRKSWMAHIEESRNRPVLIIDEAQELKPPVLSELRMLASAKLDSVNLLTVVLAGDMRLVDRLRSEEFLPLASRMRVRLTLDRIDASTLESYLRHALAQAGVPRLITDEVIATMADHACGNLRA
ncbi:MAG: ATP-binding protein, partial [Acidobacteriaceae bacterium]|nr:ATP-binding protein [Acidobacteriaceae bacterium]